MRIIHKISILNNSDPPTGNKGRKGLAAASTVHDARLGYRMDCENGLARGAVGRVVCLGALACCSPGLLPAFGTQVAQQFRPYKRDECAGKDDPYYPFTAYALIKG